MEKKGALALLRKTGRPLIEVTGAGNTADSISNGWYTLVSGAKISTPNGFKHLRKTGAQLIREISDGETASIYLAHSDVSKNDLLEVYSDRDFSKLDAALLEARKRLSSVFDQ